MMRRDFLLAAAVVIVVSAVTLGLSDLSMMRRARPQSDAAGAPPLAARHVTAIIPLQGRVAAIGPEITERLDPQGLGSNTEEREKEKAEEEEKLGPDGHKKPVGADHPGEAAAFRRLSLLSDDGEIAENGLMNAARQVREMRDGQAANGADSGAGIARGSWTWLGPGNIGGRIRSLLIHPAVPTTMWVGGADGGIWKSINGGSTWAPVDDFMANLAVSTLAISPTNSSVMFAGTGEGFYNGDGIRGAGIFRSTDGGTTWAQLASTANSSFNYVNRIAISPNGSIILAATRSGLQRSTDGGASWSFVSSVFEPVDVNFHPTDSTRAVVSGFDGDGAYSTNGGASFTMSAGLPNSGFTQRIEIAYAPSSPNIVYASVELNGGSMYVSVDGGASYTLRFAGLPDYLATQGWYGNALWVNPNDANFLIVGGVDLYKSVDGGFTFVKISDWSASPQSAHADQHVIVSHPGFNNTTNKTVYFGNDGGIYRATDVSVVGGGGSANCGGGCMTGWTSLNNNLGVTQFYGGSGHGSTGVVIGGTQDNGSLKYTPAGGVNGWQTTFGGDGGWAAIDPNNANNLYGEYVYLALHRSLNGGGTSDWINGLYWNGASYVCKAAPYRIGDPGIDGCSPTSYATGANFIAPFILDPNNPNRLYAGGQRLWRTNDASTPNTAATGPSWFAIKPSVNSNISAIAVSKVNADVIWVGHNNGAVYSTTNGTQASPTWTRRDLGAPALPDRWVNRITIDPNDSNIVYVAFGGFNADNLWRTMDGGVNWSPLTGAGGSLPAAPVRDLEISPTNSAWLYAATEVGLFVSETAGASWMLPQDGPANVSVDELFFMGTDLVAVTHGRGMFKQSAVGPPPTTGVISGTVTNAANGLPVSGIEVGLYAADGTWVAWSLTSAGGQYSFPNLNPGIYRLRTFNAQGYVNEMYNDIPCAVSCTITDGTGVVVSAGVVTINTNFALTPGGRISGRVTNQVTGLGIANAFVEVYDSAGRPVATVVANANGNYQTSEGLTAGTYFVRTAVFSGFSDEVFNNIACAPFCSVVSGTPVPVALAVTSSNINFELAPGQHIHGTVTNAADGQPLPGVSVWIFNASGFGRSVTTEAFGQFQSPGLPPGTYYLRTSNDQGFVDERYDNQPCIGGTCGATSGTGVIVTAAGPTTGIDFALDRGAQVHGRVSDQATNAGLQGVTVDVLNSASATVLSVGSDASGNYTTPAIPSGTYWLRTRNALGLAYVDEAYDNVPCAGCNVVGVGTPVNVFPGNGSPTVDFPLSNDGARISGLVTTAGGVPLGGATVSIYNAAGAFVTSATSASSGNFTGSYITPNGLPSGAYFARVVASGFISELFDNIDCVYNCSVTDGTPINLSPGVMVPNVNFSMADGGRISGRVTNNAGVGLAGVQISVYSPAGLTVLGTSTDAQGNYVTPSGLPQGTYFVRTTNSGAYIDEIYNNIACVGCSSQTPGAPVAVSPGVTTPNINFALDPGARITGRITDATTGLGIGTASALVFTPSRVLAATAPVNGTGHYTTPAGLPAGSYYVKTFNAQQYIDEAYNNITCVGCDPAAATAVNVIAGGTTSGVDFGLVGGGGRITGTVTNSATGLPVSGVLIGIYTAGNDLVTTVMTDASGNYTTGTGLTAGNYYAKTSNSVGLVNEAYNNIACLVCNATIGAPIPVALGGTTAGINFNLDPGAVISGIVTANATGKPMAGVTVGLFNSTGVGVSSPTTTANGSFQTATGVPGGTYYARTLNAAAFVYEEQLYSNIPCLAGCTPLNGTPIVVPALNVTPNVTNINFSLLTATPRLTISASTAAANAPVTVTLRNGLGGAMDWLALAPAGAADTSYLQYIYVGAGVVNRTWTFNAPASPGPYEVRLFQNDGFVRLATSPIISVVPGLSIGDVSLDEGQSGITTAFFNVTLSAPSTQVVSVSYATSNGTATAGSDYVGTSGSLNFSPGVTSLVIPVTINGDVVFEPNETFTVTLSNPLNAILSNATAIGTIRADDGGPTLAIDDVSVVEGDSGTVTALFTVTLSPAAAGNVTVDFVTANGTATAGSDYTARSGTLAFAPGQQSQTIAVTVTGDTVAESNETFFVDLSNASVNSVIGDGHGIGTIINDEGPRLTVNTSIAASGAPVTVTLANAPGGATDWITLAAVGAPEQTYLLWTYVGSGLTTRNWTVPMPPVPGQYEFRFYLNNSFTRTATSAPVTVRPGMTISDASIAEGNSGTVNLAFTVSLSAPSPGVVSVQYATGGGTATAGTDYTATSGTLTFAPNQVSMQVLVPVIGDVTFEPTETLSMSLSNAANAIITDADGIGTIVNDDLGPTLTINDVSVVEGDSGTVNAVFTVTLNPVAANVTVDYATANLSAIAPGDYAPTSGSLIFPGNTSSQTITVVVNGDLLQEPNETFAVNLSNVSFNAAIGDPQGVGTIVNDEGPRLTPNVTSAPANGPVTVSLNNTPGGATDWVVLAPAGAPDATYLNWTYVGAGVTSRTWTINMPPIPGQYEFRLFANNTFTRLATSAPVNVLPGISVNDVAIAEGNAGSTNAVFTLTLSAPGSQPITVQYATADGTATSGSDYTAVSNTATFAPGVTTVTISVPVSGDVTFEQTETFTLGLSNPTNAVISDNTGIGTIQNDDLGPTLSVSDAALVEGDSGSSLMTFSVSLSPAGSGNVSVNYATADQTANAGSDYTAASGTLFFGAGETLKTFTVPVIGDTTREANETFLVNLSNSSVNAAIGDGQGIGTITNDDGPRITVSSNASAPGLPVTFELLNGLGGPTDWLALAPAGSPNTTYVSFVYVGAGVTTRTWTVNLPQAPLGGWEARLFENNTYNRLATSPQIVTMPGVSISDVAIDEGNSGNRSAAFVVTLSGPSSSPITMQYATVDGTAVAPGDYIAVSGNLTFNPGVVQQLVQVPIISDTNFEPNENFTVVLSNPANALLTDATGLGTIKNDDAGPTLSINDVSLNEGDSGSSLMTFTVSLLPASSGNVTVDYATANQTAVAGSDYTATAGTLVFAPGDTSKTFTVAILGDLGAEPNETFRVDLSNASITAAIGDGVGIGTIISDDGPRIVPSVSSAAPGTLVTFTLNNSPGGPTDWLALAPANAPDTTYTQFVYVGAGITSRNWTVAMPMAPLGPWEARLFENNTYNRIATSAAVNVAPGLSVNDVTIAEGNSGSSVATFTVTLSGPSSQAIAVQYATSNGTATAGSDYTATSGTLTLNPGVVSQTFGVSISGDVTFEPNETFTVTLSNPSGALLTDAAGIGTISNDDAGPTLAINDVSLAEGDSGSTPMTFTVSLLPASSGNVTVDYATVNQTALAGSDYTAASGTVVFAPGETSKTLTVAILGDLGGEPNETFRVDLSNANLNAVIGDAFGIGTIINDDGPRIFPSAASSAPGGAVTFTLNNSPGGPTDWLALAPAGAPDTTYSTYVYVGAGVTSRAWTVNMPVAPLGLWEARLFENNTFNRLATSTPVNVQAGLSVNDVTIAEGNAGASTVATFTVTLSGASTQPITVQYATSNDTATAGSDYAATSGTLTFNPGIVSQTFGVSISGDVTFEPNETFIVTLSNPTGALLTDATGIGTITNDDAGPTLSINDVSLVEGDSGSTPMTFTVSLLPAASGNVTVNYVTANQTALAGSDYTSTSGAIVFAPGETSKTFTVGILGDPGFEPNETFRVDLSNASVGAAIGDGLGIGTIINDDGPRIVPSVASVAPGGAVTFTLNNSPGGPLDWMALAPVGSADTAYVSYIYVGAGVTSRAWTVNMPLAPLGAWEVRLLENNGYNRLATSTPVQTIPGLSISDVTIDEGNSGNRSAAFVVSLAGPTSQVVTVQYATSDGTAASGSDYIGVSGSLTFNPGVMQQTVQVPILTDTNFEPNENFSIVLSNPANALLTDAIGVGTIQNDDAGPALSINDVSLNEGDSGSSLMTFTVTLSPASSGNVSVDYATANQTATAGSDYTATSGTLIYPPGQTSKTFTVAILGDPGTEPNETFRVDLSNVNGSVAIADGVGVGTIINDDGPRLTVSAGSAATGEFVNVLLSNSPGGAQDWIALAPSSAPNESYVAYTYVGAGVTSRNWTVAAPNAAGPYEFRLFLDNGFTRAATSAVLNVLPVASVQANVDVNEGNSGTANAIFNVTLSAASASAVTVTYSTADVTATAGSDYSAASGTLTFPAGATLRTISVPIIGDTTVESSETFTVTLSNPTNAALGTVTRTGTIINDDSAGPCADSDGDRLCNAFETNTGVYVSALNTGTSPNVADTDGDGILDGDEVLGTLAGLDLPGMGASPVKKNILFEYDWFDDTFNDPGVNGDVCGAHTHRPTAAMIARVSASFAASPLTNPDGTTGITLIHDYGQGGGFTGGSLVAHAPNVTGGVDGVDFINTKNANFAANRNGYFHYVMMGHWYTDALGSSGQAELPGDDLIVTLGCFNSTNNGANTIMHEAGHNFNIRHGGNENCNWKPNYNSVMNYRFQFPGVDTSCNAIGNSGESNVLDYSRGVRIPLNENALNENGGTCGATPIDWNFSGTFTSGLVYDLNRNSSNPTAATAVENFGCAANLQTLNDHNDWANMSFTGLTDGDGNSILGLWLYYAKELLTETNSVALLAPGVLVGQQQ